MARLFTPLFKKHYSIMEVKTKREAVIELANKLFVHTDSRQWQSLIKDVFKETVYFDMSSMGAGDAKTISSQEICKMWEAGFKDIDHVFHQSGNFIVDFYNEDVQAKIFCYATATHFKSAAKKGTTRTYFGSYELHATFTDLGWRIDKFLYDLKYVTGNAELA
jgi:hypothetical protein